MVSRRSKRNRKSKSREKLSSREKPPTPRKKSPKKVMYLNVILGSSTL